MTNSWEVLLKEQAVPLFLSVARIKAQEQRQLTGEWFHYFVAVRSVMLVVQNRRAEQSQGNDTIKNNLAGLVIRVI